jgi:hypothetical protein
VGPAPFVPLRARPVRWLRLSQPAPGPAMPPLTAQMRSRPRTAERERERRRDLCLLPCPRTRPEHPGLDAPTATSLWRVGQGYRWAHAAIMISAVVIILGVSVRAPPSPSSSPISTHTPTAQSQRAGGQPTNQPHSPPSPSPLPPSTAPRGPRRHGERPQERRRKRAR